VWSFGPLPLGGQQDVAGGAITADLAATITITSYLRAAVATSDSLTTTETALRTGQAQIGYSLTIDGYENILTDAASTAAVVSAYQNTSWSSAIPGLEIIGAIKQSIEPFKEDLDIPQLTFQVMDCDGSDVFGKAVWKSKPTFQSRLASAFEPSTDGSGTITVQSNTGTSSPAASGTLYIGTKRVAYSAKSGGTAFTLSAGGAGQFSPFTASGSNVYSWPQNLATGANFDLAASPRVSDVPQAWVGRKVALRIHRIKGGVWDSVAQSHLEFAGVIAKVEDGDGVTVLQCHDLRKQIESATLLRDQYIGTVKDGIYLRTGDKLKIGEHASGSATTWSSSSFTVVASGASGVSQIDAGYYTVHELLEALTDWAQGASMGGEWTVYMPRREQGYRCVFRATFSTAAQRSIEVRTNSPHIFEFLGFTDYEGGDDDGGWLSVNCKAKYKVANSSWFITSARAPYRVKALQRGPNGAGRLASQRIDMDSSEGSWFDHHAYLPNGLKQFSSGTDNWSYILIGDGQLAACKYTSATQLDSVIPVSGFGSPITAPDWDAPGITFDEDRSPLEVRQIVYMTGKFSSLVPMMIGSIDGRGVNNATYDSLPWGAGIPWSLLGDDFLNSCKSLEAAQGTDTISIVLDKPTRIKDLLIPEMALRFAFLVFKDGVYQFASPPTPNATDTDHTLDETNKASKDGNPGWSSAEQTSEWLANVIKIQYRRGFDGAFHGAPLTIRDTVSIDMFGETQPITIDAVNSSDDSGSMSGSTVEHLAGIVAARILPMFGRPVKIIRRTIAPSLYHMAPGDTVTISDDMVRDPDTGARGIANRAGIVLSVSHDYGHEGGTLHGECTILIGDEDRTYSLSPAVEIDTSYTSGLYTNGYDSTNFRLRIKTNSFSRSTDGADITNLDDDDKVRIVELDPADPTAPDAWSRTLAGSGSGVVSASSYIQLTAAISSPAWGGSTKKYVVIPQGYSAVQASQKLHTFQADDSDGMIADAANPNTYGTGKKLVFDASDVTDLPALIPTETYGDGKPVTPYQLQYLAKMANNLVSYKTATHRPWCWDANIYQTSVTSYEIACWFPFYLGGYDPAERTRSIMVGPVLWSDNVLATASLRVYASRNPPTGSSGSTSWDIVGPYTYVDFSTADTTQLERTPQALTPVMADLYGFTWLTFAAKISDAAYLCNLRGCRTLYLGPIA
jgi:hypothetical protein